MRVEGGPTVADPIDLESAPPSGVIYGNLTRETHLPGAHDTPEDSQKPTWALAHQAFSEFRSLIVVELHILARDASLVGI